MKTSTFITTLRQNGSLPLVFRAQGETISPGYHLTEVKRVTYETMDCGSMSHEWTETQIEVWVPPLAGITPGRGHMPADKFLRIIDRVEAKLPLKGEALVRIHAAFDGQLAALHDIESVTVKEGALLVELSPDRTRCKAAELTGGCCGIGEGQQADEPAGAGCGCSSSKAPANQEACCV
jgi:hypothetical protein